MIPVNQPAPTVVTQQVKKNRLTLRLLPIGWFVALAVVKAAVEGVVAPIVVELMVELVIDTPSKLGFTGAKNGVPAGPIRLMHSYGGRGSKVPCTGTMLVVMVLAVSFDMINPYSVATSVK